MDFFASQEAARRSSRTLLVLFGLAIISIVALANLAAYLLLAAQHGQPPAFDLELVLTISAGVLLLVAIGTVYRIYSLRQGGEVIAAGLGGHLVTAGGGDVLQQRLINVVEEMAIASGIPVPPVYLIDEDGINAFAAGFHTDDAVIGVTRGAVEQLTRDQLQGVVAHEFSHIINGDMKLNIRLVGLLHGVLILAFAGRAMMRARFGRSRDAVPIMLAGVSLFVIGYVGKFFGDLIKASVSRQREYLADASAVQFTRNNAGIAGALKRIGGFESGSNVSHANADEFSHLYFSSSGRQALATMLATHPPLPDRIKRLEPNWDGGYLEQLAQNLVEAEEEASLVKGFSSDHAVQPTTNFTPDNITQSVGSLQQVEVAVELLSEITPGLREAVREPYSVRAVMYGLFLHKDETRREAQSKILTEQADVFVRSRLRELEETIKDLELQHRLPLIELALPTLRQLSRVEYKRLASNIDEMLKVSAPITLSEWALSYYLHHHMADKKPRATGSRSLARLSREIEYLLSVLAHSDGARHQSAEQAFSIGASQLGSKLERKVTLQKKQDLSIPKLEKAIENLNRLKPLQKPMVLKAFVAVIHADQILSPVEVELLRCMADAIDCPLPPLSQPIAG